MDLRGYEGRCSEFEQKIVLLSQEIERLTNFARSKQQEVDEWKSRSYQQENALNEAKAKIQSLEGKIRDFENRVALLTSEIERLNTVLKQRIGENDELRIRISQLESQLEIIKQYELKISQYEERVALMSQEVQRLNGSLRGKQQEIDELRGKIAQFESLIQ